MNDDTFLFNIGLIPSFLKMISRQNLKQSKANASDNIDVQNNQTVISQPKRVVYVNAIFELQDGSKLPNTKLELVKLLKTKKAIPFHKWVCPVCHTIPKFEMWQHTDLMAGKKKGKVIIKCNLQVLEQSIKMINPFN